MLAVTGYSNPHNNTLGLFKPFLISGLIHSIVFLALTKNIQTATPQPTTPNLSYPIRIEIIEKFNGSGDPIEYKIRNQQDKAATEAPSASNSNTASFVTAPSKPIFDIENTIPAGLDFLNNPPLVRKKAYGCLLEIAEAAWQYHAAKKTFRGFNIPDLKCISNFSGIYEFEWDAYATDEEFQISAEPIETVFSDSECKTLHISNSMNFTASGPLGQECGLGAKD